MQWITLPCREGGNEFEALINIKSVDTVSPHFGEVEEHDPDLEASQGCVNTLVTFCSGETAMVTKPYHEVVEYFRKVTDGT